MATPEAQARQQMDAALAASGWLVQDYKALNLGAGQGIAIREVPLKSGRCDYLPLVDRRAIGVIEAKKHGTTLSTVADQLAHYAANPGHRAVCIQAVLLTKPFPVACSCRQLSSPQSDSHAEDIINLVREVFGLGNDFAKKSAVHSVTGQPADCEQLIREFRLSPQFRIPVTVTMIATGTDIKPLEFVFAAGLGNAYKQTLLLSLPRTTPPR